LGEREHVVLVGMMGTGKTTVGRRIAERLGRPFLDSDEMIEARTGKTVREIFESDGEPAFRVLESAVLREALTGSAPAVIAAAGGSVVDPENRAAMRESAHVVWLRADPTVLAARVAETAKSGHRPLLAQDPSSALRRLNAERLALYNDVADAVVDVDHLTPDEAVDRVMGTIPR
jgi:shikimate kinase